MTASLEWSKVLWVVYGLLLSALPLTGAYLHVQRLRRTGMRSAWAGTAVAVILTALVLLIAVWAGWQEFIGYGPIIDRAQVAPQVSSAVIGFIASWVLSTLAALAAWTWFVLRARSSR